MSEGKTIVFGMIAVVIVISAVIFPLPKLPTREEQVDAATVKFITARKELCIQQILLACEQGHKDIHECNNIANEICAIEGEEE